MGDKIGIGIIGCGRWGQNLIRVFSQLPEAGMIICCNKSDSDRLIQIEKLYPGLKTTQDAESVINNPDIDAVVTATPDQIHFDISRKALNAGKHVFVEKPMAMSLADAKTLVDLAKSKRKVIMTGHIMQYHPAIQWIRSRLVEKAGNVAAILSNRIEFGGAKEDSSLLWSTVVHDISIIQYLLGNEPLDVCAVGASLSEIRLEDIMHVNLIYPPNTIAHVSAAYVGPYRDRRLVLHTTGETMVFNGLDGSLELYARKTPAPKGEYGIREFEKQYESVQKVELKGGQEPLKAECQHFIDCIKSGKESSSGGENALAVMRTLDKIEKALEKSVNIR